MGGTVDKEYIDLGSILLATIDKSVSPEVVTHHHNDHLSVRVNTDSSGTIIGQQGHYPFGELWYQTGANPPFIFTNYYRDSDAGLDYFIARHYASNTGRFLQPDEFQGGPVNAFSSNDPLQSGPLPYASIANPQSLNKYTYVLNNPLIYIDPNGHKARQGGIPSVSVGGAGYRDYSYWKANSGQGPVLSEGQAQQQNNQSQNTQAVHTDHPNFIELTRPQHPDIIAVVTYDSKTQTFTLVFSSGIVRVIQFTLMMPDGKTEISGKSPMVTLLERIVPENTNVSISGVHDQSRAYSVTDTIRLLGSVKDHKIFQQILVNGDAVQIFDKSPSGKLINGRWWNTLELKDGRFTYNGKP